jgi:NAD(P)-dependent dehydrogenase (short-subunit alcohol dehydrogenase family)
MTYESVEEIPDEEWDRTLATNLSAYFHLVKAALPHMPKGSAIIGSSSVNSDSPNPTLMPGAMTKAGIANMTASMAQLLGPRGIRASSVAPGRLDTPLGRPGQPAELAPVYVLLASDEASYASGARVAVTGGRPVL